MHLDRELLILDSVWKDDCWIVQLQVLTALFIFPALKTLNWQWLNNFPRNDQYRRPQKCVQGTTTYFAYLCQVVDDAMQIDVDKALFGFYTTKKMPGLGGPEGASPSGPLTFSWRPVLPFLNFEFWLNKFKQCT